MWEVLQLHNFVRWPSGNWKLVSGWVFKLVDRHGLCDVGSTWWSVPIQLANYKEKGSELWMMTRGLIPPWIKNCVSQISLLRCGWLICWNFPICTKLRKIDKKSKLTHMRKRKRNEKKTQALIVQWGQIQSARKELRVARKCFTVVEEINYSNWGNIGVVDGVDI